MSIAAPLQGHFDGGEISPLLQGRVEAERYKASLALCKNWLPTLQGGLPRRPGTKYVGTVKSSTVAVRLIPFEYSTTQSYILEIGEGYIRFFSNYGQVLNGLGAPLEIFAPYIESDLADLRWTQSADVLYLVHPRRPPMKLERFSATNWQLVRINFKDGPYRTINTTACTLTPAATTGAGVAITFGPVQTVAGCANNGAGLIRVNVVAHGWQTGQPVYIAAVVGTTEANGSWIITQVDADHFDLQNSAFVHAYVSGGSMNPTGYPGANFAEVGIGIPDSSPPVRIENGSTWGWGYLAGYTGQAIVLDIQSALGGTGATASWALGLWYQLRDLTTNYPAAATFHEDRLSFAGTKSEPQRVDGSKSADYEIFSPTAADGAVANNNAISFPLNANDVNSVAWLNSDEKALLGGASSAEWTIRPSLSSEALTPTNVSAKRSTKWGSAAISPVQVGRATLFIQRGGRKLREMSYFFDIDGYRSTDLTELAEHITGTGVVEMVYTAIPYPIVWLRRIDGQVIGMTYDRDAAQLRVGWHQHVLGGQSDASGTAPIIESIAVIPDPAGVKDDLWMIVRRRINGVTVKTIEYLSKVFEGIDKLQDAYHLDCGATYDNPLTITGISTANPAVVNIAAHGLSTGNRIRIDDVIGMEVNGVSAVNGLSFTITVVDANHISLDGLNTTSGTAWVSGGKARKLVTTISGLTWLENEMVAVFADGAYVGTKVVSNSGAVTLDVAAAVVSIGYAYNSDGKLLRLESGSRNGTSLGKTRRTHRVGALLFRAQQLLLGDSFSNLFAVDFVNEGQDNGGEMPSLFSGIASCSFESDYGLDNQIFFRVSDPVPATLLAVMPQLETQDRA